MSGKPLTRDQKIDALYDALVGMQQAHTTMQVQLTAIASSAGLLATFPALLQALSVQLTEVAQTVSDTQATTINAELAASGALPP